MQTGIYSRPWNIVPACAAMHVTFAISYLIDAKVGSITALHLAHEIFGAMMWLVLLVIGLAAVAPMAVLMPAKWVHVCLWPQQFLLFLMVCSALQATFLGAYPDGYKATPVFIFADQCYAIYFMLAHLAAMRRNARFH